MTTSGLSVLNAAPPRYQQAPPSVSSAGREAADLAASAGLVLDEWQVLVLERALGERPNGKWAALEVGLVVPRQNGKGSILEARELAGLFLFEERLQTHTAHRFDTCLEHYNRLRTLIEGCPDLHRRVKAMPDANGKEAIILKSGARLNFKARSKGSGRGFSGDLVVLDEAYWLHELGSMIPTMSARMGMTPGGPQLWYTSSAPEARAESDRLRRLIRRGRSLSDDAVTGLAYMEWSAGPDSLLDDQEAWADANPGLDTRVDRAFIAGVERPGMTDEEFARERLGIYDDVTDVSALPPHDWKRCAKPKLLVQDPVAYGIDLTPDRSYGSIGAAGRCSEDGVVAVEVVEHRTGAGWMLDRIIELVERHHPTHVVIDARSAAGSLIDPLEAAGIEVVKARTGDHIAACGGFFDDVVNHKLAHRSQPELEAAVAGASMRTVSDAWLWNRRGSSVITPLVAVTLARWGHLQPVEDTTPPESIYKERGMTVLG